MTQQVRAIIWDGTNLREVIDLIGLHPSANKWTWEEYEQVVKEEGLKVFTPDGPVMAEIGEVIVKLKFFGCFVSKLINTKQKEAEECL